MKNILVIGGSGFIGENIVEALKSSNYNILTLSKNKSPIKHGVLNITGKISDINLIKEYLLLYQIEIVIHLASNLIPSSSYDQFRNELKEIIYPTYDLLKLLSVLGIKIIFFSSGGTIYGNVQNIVDETYKAQPINYYGHSKYLIENKILLLHKIKNLNYLILRPSNVYGKFQKTDRPQGFIAVALNRILNGLPIDIYGDGEEVRDYIDVTDVSNILLLLIQKNINNQTFNVSTGKGNSLNNIVLIFQKYFSNDITVLYHPKRKTDVNKIILDNTTLKSNISYQFKDLETGIIEYIRYIEKILCKIKN